MKRTASPAISLFELTNTLQPVVRRCLFGWPEIEMEIKYVVSIFLGAVLDYIIRVIFSQTKRLNLKLNTSINMSESPCLIMQIFSCKLLTRRLHREILQKRFSKVRLRNPSLHRITIPPHQWLMEDTRGGKIFSAALRGTEKPPWVLVSLAVRVLQKNSVGCLLCLSPISDTSNASWSYCSNINELTLSWIIDQKIVTKLISQNFESI